MLVSLPIRRVKGASSLSEIGHFHGSVAILKIVISESVYLSGSSMELGHSVKNYYIRVSLHIRQINGARLLSKLGHFEARIIN